MSRHPRSGKNPVSCTEPSSEDHESTTDDSSKPVRSTKRSNSSLAQSMNNQEQRERRLRAGVGQPSTSRHTFHGKSKKLKLSHSNSATCSIQVRGSNLNPSLEKIPPWQTLPYHVLVQIFRFASYPLYDAATFQPLRSGRLLCKIARLCRSFAEPALTVLYASPPLVPMNKARQLVEVLKTDPERLTFKYRQKVESLRIDVGQVVAYSMGARLGHLDLNGLIKSLPRLVDLEFYHQDDMAPYRDLTGNIKWTYPDALFEALEYVEENADHSRGDKISPCRLRSWRWSSRMAGKKWPITRLKDIHCRPSFEHLTKIAFVNYRIPKLKKDEDDPGHEKVLAGAICALKELRHIILEASTLVNANLLQLLPRTLRVIELINCAEVTAADLADFLLTHGAQLRCLTLHHNQALSLSFLPVLAAGCPRLQVLRMNFTYFKMHAAYNDTEPEYAELLRVGETPAWPETLQTIELVNMRHWTNAAAEMFFQSLLDSAGSLRELRFLTMHVILDVPWRERASFRDRWIGVLTSVFKKPSAETTVSTLGQEEQSTNTSKRRSKSRSTSTRRSARNASANLRKRSTQSQRSRRASQARPDYHESTDSSQSSQDDEGETSESDARRIEAAGSVTLRDEASSNTLTPHHAADVSSTVHGQTKQQQQIIQGMCEVVDLRIDNLRPGETHFLECDFLDEAPNEGDDPDWNEDVDDEVASDHGYAW